jgi:uncharacterized repeat protein (TIGR01451 family)
MHPRLGLRTVLVLLVLAALALPAAAQNDNARSGSVLGGPPPLVEGPVPPGCVAEGFDNIMVLPGWFMQNNSQPIGVINWFQGNSAVFPAQAGPPTSYIGANFNNGGGVATISNWLLTPELNLSAIDNMTFWTRSVTGSIFPDRLQVRYSTAGPSTDVGTLATDLGDFGNLALDINPTYVVGGYPQVYTQFTLTSAEISAPGTGRIAFRYFVENGGPAGANSDYIGIDTFQFCELQEADLALTKTSDAVGSVPPGATVVYTLTVTNNGPAGATNVVVVDTLPVGVTWVSDTCAAGPPVGQVLTWNVGALPNAGSAVCDITVTVDVGASGTLINSATASATEADPVTADNTATAAIDVGQPVQEIPTLGGVGLALLALLLAAASLLVFRRRAA